MLSFRLLSQGAIRGMFPNRFKYPWVPWNGSLDQPGRCPLSNHSNEALLHTYIVCTYRVQTCASGTRVHKTVDLLKSGSLVKFPGPPTYRGEYTHIHTLLCFSPDSILLLSTFMFVMFPSYVLDSTGSVRFLIVVILPPLLDDGLSGQFQ